MKILNGQRILGLGMIILSGITYLLYFMVFNQPKPVQP